MNVETKEFNLLAPFAITKKDATIIGGEESITIAGYASYCGLDSSGKAYVDLQGDILNIDGLDLSVWAMNSVILMNHNRECVIGKGVTVEKRSDGLYVECEIFKNATDPQDWFRLSTGLITTFSVGFRSVDGMYKELDGQEVWIITKSLLLEISCVGIPASSMSIFARTKELGLIDLGVKETNETKEDTLMNIKLKRSDLLTEKELESFKSMGGNVTEEVEVELATFIKDTVAKEVAAVLAAKEAADLEAKAAEDAKVAEDAAKELAAQEELAKKDEEAKLAMAAEVAAMEAEKEAADLIELKSLVETLRTALTAEEK